MQDILQALNWRYAVKIFDATKKVSDTDLHDILESGRLAPSATGVEAWKFLVIENPALRTALRAASYDQPKVTDASHLIVIARRTDIREHIAQELLDRTAEAQHVDVASLEGLRQMVEGGIAHKNDAELDAWIRCQSYIPLGMMIETAAMMEIDTCPMEGFDPAAVDAALDLTTQHLAATAMLAVGYRGKDPAADRAKVRRAFEDVATFIR